MAIKVNGVTVIDDDRKGIFNKVSAGNYTTAEREALGSLSEGELVYDTTAKKLFIYDGSAWAGVGGGGGNGLVSSIPPFAAHAETDTFLKSTDGKVEFSLDNSTYTTTLAVPRNTQYFVGWGTDIRHASNGSSYSVSIGVTFPQVGASGTTKTIDYEITSVDKVPDTFGFTSMTDVQAAAEFESDIVNPFESINAPASIWVTSDASAYKLRIGVGTWFDPPGVIGTAFVVNRNEEIQVKHTTGTGVLTDYTTTVNVGYGTAVGQFTSADFLTVTQSASVDTPSITSPSQGASVDSEVYTISASAFSGQNAGTHHSTQWQIAEDSGFSTLLENVTSTTQKTTYTPTSGTSYVDQTAYARVRYIGSLNSITSAWSNTVSYTPQQWFIWKVQLKLKGGSGAQGSAPAGGRGGAGQWTVENATFSYEPPDTVAGTIGGQATSRSGAGGYGNGGTSNSCSKGTGGGGGGSSSMTWNGTIVAVAGGGGGGGGGDSSNKGGGGQGGYPGANGGGGGGHDTAGGGSGGTVSSSGGNGSNATSCGTHSNDRRSGGSGGGGGNGGGAGGGTTSTQGTVAGGGGGGGGYFDFSSVSNFPTRSTVTNISSNYTNTSSGTVEVKLYRATRSAQSTWIEQQTYTDSSGSYSVTLSSLKS